MTNGKKAAEVQRAERFAIACQFFGAAVVIAQFIVPKTPYVVLASCLFLFSFLVYPLFVFLHTTGKRIAGGILLAIFTLLLGIYSWPDTDPTSDLSLEQVISHPFIAGMEPAVNMVYYNHSLHSIRGVQINHIVMERGFSSQEAERTEEDILWAQLEKNVSEIDSSPIMPFTSRAKTWATVTGNQALSEEQAKNLSSGNGLTSVYFMTVILYRDSSGEHELDSCTIFQKSDVPNNCQNHVGPAEPMKHKPLLPKKHFWDGLF